MNVKFQNDALCQSWLKLAHWLWREPVNSLRQQCNNGRQMSYKVDKSRDHQTFFYNTLRHESR